MESIDNIKVSAGYKILSVINYIFVAVFILFSLVLVIGGIYFLLNKDSLIEQLFGGSLSGAFGTQINTAFSTFYGSFGWIALAIGIFFLVFSIFLFFVGVGLWKAKKWARISEIILSVLWIVLWSIELFNGALFNLIPIFPSLIVLGYLIFNKGYKEL